MKSEWQPCIDIIGAARCTGCFGCQSACPTHAVDLPLDREGFYKPVVARAACTKCGACQRTCPVMAYDEGRLPAAKWPEPKAFAAWTTDETLRDASSSGGIFSELARPVISAGGTVAGCVWDANWTPQHILARTWRDVERMRGSKYVPSHVSDTYHGIVEHLRGSDTPVLFSGTPCQVAAMEAKLDQKQRERSVLVEVICHGVPSLRVFREYLRELFHRDAIASYTFRDKTFGWQSVLAESVCGRRHHVPAHQDAFFRGFSVHHLYVMEACYSCAFARFPRAGDISLGDFWGCPDQWYDKQGLSIALANTQKGLDALESLVLSERVVLKPAHLQMVTKGSPRLVTSKNYIMPESRRMFLDGIIKGKSFRSLTARYYPQTDFKWRDRWSRFRHTSRKLQFLTDVVQRRLGKLRGKCSQFTSSRSA